MGCAQSSAIETEEVVSRCKGRKQLMMAAVSSRNAFAATHSSYAIALKNTGAALTDYALTAATTTDPNIPPHPNSPPPPPPPHHLRPPPPPPPLPNFLPLQRAASMPDLPLPKRKTKKPPGDDVIREEDDGGGGRDATVVNSPVDVDVAVPPPPPPPPPPPRDQPSPPPPPADDKGSTAWDYFFFPQSPSLGGEESKGAWPDRREEEIRPETPASSPSASSSAAAAGAGAVVDSASPVTVKKGVVEAPPPTTKEEPSKLAKKLKQEGPSVHHRHAASMGASEVKKGKLGGSSPAPASVNLTGMLIELDNHFVKAYESVAAVSKMLDAARFHYHSNFADNCGHIDHSVRVMRVITWNKSSKGTPGNGDGRDVFNDEESETHSTTLDKLLAWEKKLYKEVKASELMKIEYQRKVAQLNKQKKRGVNPVALEKTKAVVSHLYTRYIVDMQSLDSTVSEIQRLRDRQLYPKLTILVDGMAKMWETMYAHHDSQQKIVMDIQSVDISSTPKETSQQLYDRTAQLHRTASEWHSQFDKFVIHQKDYIQSLSSWLRLNLIPIESNLKEKVSSPSPQRPHQPPIQILLRAWHEQLEKLPDDRAKSALCSFAAVIDAIMVQQQEELKQKEKYESARKEYSRKETNFGNWLDKQNSRRKPTREADREGSENASKKEQMTEKKFEVEHLKKRVEVEEDSYLNLCKQVREKSVGSLKMHLPDLFRAMLDFSFACVAMCKNLQTITQTHNQATTS